MEWKVLFFQNLVPMKAFSCDVFVQRVPLCPNAPTARTLELCCQLLALQLSLLRGLQAQFLCSSYRDALILFPCILLPSLQICDH